MSLWSILNKPAFLHVITFSTFFLPKVRHVACVAVTRQLKLLSPLDLNRFGFSIGWSGHKLLTVEEFFPFVKQMKGDFTQRVSWSTMRSCNQIGEMQLLFSCRFGVSSMMALSDESEVGLVSQSRPVIVCLRPKSYGHASVSKEEQCSQGPLHYCHDIHQQCDFGIPRYFATVLVVNYGVFFFFNYYSKLVRLCTVHFVVICCEPSDHHTRQWKRFHTRLFNMTKLAQDCIKRKKKSITHSTKTWEAALSEKYFDGYCHYMKPKVCWPKSVIMPSWNSKFCSL